MNPLHRISIKSLYTFSVAAHYLNFTQAAKELHITPSAVSHQIKRLEDTLGCKLFETKGKVISLTSEAESYFKSIQTPFNQIIEATKEFTDYDKSTIQIGVSSAFAVQRISTELRKWQNNFSGIDIRLRMLTYKDEFDSLNLDIILSGEINDSKYYSEFITDESYYPVCSQSTYDTLKKEDLQQTISNAPLIDIIEVNCWKDWCNWKGYRIIDTSKITYFSHTLLILQAVHAGQGIAILEKSLVESDLAAGKLILLDDTAYQPPGQAYYVSYPKNRHRDVNIQRLKQSIINLF